MNNDIAIKVENLSKVYKLYDSPIDRMKEALHWRGKKYHKDFYALNDVSFEIKKGETVGIIGKNGSGKSTLLKIITGVLTPTSGKVTVNGKVSALLELGAGFNPEYTGIENIYFQGNLMGYTREQMDARVDDILAFADIGDFIHQPVKMYSSGMFARLAFAVAINVEPDILIVDEALSVGDALFQKKCFKRILELQAVGMTILLVSHEQEVIRNMSRLAILLRNGAMDCCGEPAIVARQYMRYLQEEDERTYKQINKENEHVKKEIIEDSSGSYGNGAVVIYQVRVVDYNGLPLQRVYAGDEFCIEIYCLCNEDIDNLNISFRIRNKEGVKVTTWGTLNEDMQNNKDLFWGKCFNKGDRFRVSFCGTCNLAANLYQVEAFVTKEYDRYYGSQRILYWIENALNFNVLIKNKVYVFDGICDIKLRSRFESLNKI